MISIKLQGKQKVFGNIRRAKASGFKGGRSGIIAGLEHIQKRASSYLEDKSDSARWHGGGGSNINRPNESINANWIPIEKPITRGNTVDGILGNSSPHAHMVEYGTNSPITSVGGGKMWFWGGDSYGWQDRWEVRGQPGKHYLQAGIDMSKDWIVGKIGSDIKSYWMFK